MRICRLKSGVLGGEQHLGSMMCPDDFSFEKAKLEFIEKNGINKFFGGFDDMIGASENWRKEILEFESKTSAVSAVIVEDPMGGLARPVYDSFKEFLVKNHGCEEVYIEEYMV